MTSHRLPAPLLLLCTFATACYAPSDEVTTTGADGEGGSSDSDTGTDPTTAPTSTVNPSEPTSSPTGESEASGPGTSADSTGDSGGPTVCGDGMVEGDEACDDGVNDGSYDGCVADCTARGPHCGDGIEHGGEDCDDGDQINGNGCNINCIVSASVLWTHTADLGTALALDVDEDDGVLVGYSYSEFQYLDADGNVGWEGSYSYPSGTQETVESVDFHALEGWVIAGRATTDANGNDIWWRRYSADGNVDGTTTYDNPSHTSDGIGGAALDSSGRLYVFGGSSLNGDYDVWLRKFDVDGEEMWTQPYDGGGDDFTGAIAIDADDYIVVGGSTEVDGEGRNTWLRKYSPEGAMQWEDTASSNGPFIDRIDDIAIGTDGAVAVIGSEADNIWMRKFDSDGSVQWTDTYDGPSDIDCTGQYCFLSDIGNGVAVDSVGAIIFVGSHVVPGDGVDTDTKSTWIRKYDADGSELWTNEVDAPEFSLVQGARDVIVTSTDDIVVAGVSDFRQGAAALGWVQKYAP